MISHWSNSLSSDLFLNQLMLSSSQANVFFSRRKEMLEDKMHSFPVLLGLICLILFLFFGYPEIAKSYSSLCIFNAKDVNLLPKMFRTAPDLQVSGSSQVTPKSLNKILDVVPSDRVALIDLREESHGFLNGDAVSWLARRNEANKGKTKNEIIQDEQTRIQSLSKKWFSFVFKNKKFPIPYVVHSAQTEEELAKSYGLEYFRLPITDHSVPSEVIVDAFIAYMRQLPEGTWLHFHCAAGKGRTSIILAMVDMMHHANKVSLQEIIARQHVKGCNDSFFEENNQTVIAKKIAFMRKFYCYCQRVPDFTITWTTFVHDVIA